MWSARGARLWRNLDRIRRGAGAGSQQGARDLLSPCLDIELSSLRPRLVSSEVGGAFVRETSWRPAGGVSAGPESLKAMRHYSQAAGAQLEGDGSESEHLLPAEEDKPEEVIKAFPRYGVGKIVSKKERRAGRAPSIVFSQENGHLGGNKQLVSVETKQIERLIKRLGKSFFLSTTFDLEVYDEQGNVQSKERVLPRSIHLHAGTDKVMNVTFIRSTPTALLKVDVPLIFIGEDACPGIRKGGYIYTMMRTVKYKCPGNIIPPGIEVDLSNLDMGEKILLKDLKAPPELSLVKRDSSLPVCKVMGSRTSSAAAEAASAS